MTLALDVGKDHQDFLDVGVPGSTLGSIIFIFILVSRGILLHACLHESTLPSGVFGKNQIALLIFLRMDLVRLVEDVTLHGDFLFPLPILFLHSGALFALAG